MEKYDYKKHVTNDLYNYFINDMDEEDRFWLVNSTNNEDYEWWFDKLREADFVTGLSSGSYTFSKWKSEECLCHNWDLAKEAYLDLFMDSSYDVLEKGPELLDSWVRYYVYTDAFSDAVDKLRNESQENQ